MKVSRSSMDFRVEREAVVPLILTGPLGAVVVIISAVEEILNAGVRILMAGSYHPCKQKPNTMTDTTNSRNHSVS